MFEETKVITDATSLARQDFTESGLPMTFASNTYCPEESRYCCIQHELLSFLWAVKCFQPYFFGKKFKVVIDHRPLTWHLESSSHVASQIT